MYPVYIVYETLGKSDWRGRLGMSNIGCFSGLKVLTKMGFFLLTVVVTTYVICLISQKMAGSPYQGPAKK